MRPAIEAGEIDPLQLENRRKLAREAERLAAEAGLNAQRQQKSQLKAMHRAQRNHPKYRR